MSVSETAKTNAGSFSLHLNLSRFLFHLQSKISDEQKQWLIHASTEVQMPSASIEELANRVISFTARAKRCLGEQVVPVKLPGGRAGELIGNAEWEAKHWSKADLARLILLASALLNTAQDKFLTLEKVYSYCDANERRSIIKGLFWLLEDDRLVEFAEEVQRTNDLDLFAALATDNPFPAVEYSESGFNQMVLKSLFLGVPVDRICGLYFRLNPELHRMCDDYLHERRLAGREIPATLWLTLSSQSLSEETQQAWLYALECDSNEQRYYAAKALVNRTGLDNDIPQRLLDMMAKRAKVEVHPTIRVLVQEMQPDTGQ